MSCANGSDSGGEPLDEDNDEGSDDAEEDAPGADRAPSARPVSAPTRVPGKELIAYKRLRKRLDSFGLRKDRRIQLALVAVLPGSQVQYWGDVPLVSAVRRFESELKGAAAQHRHEERHEQCTAVSFAQSSLTLAEKQGVARLGAKLARKSGELQWAYTDPGGSWPATWGLSGVRWGNPVNLRQNDLCSEGGERQIDALCDAVATHVPECAASWHLAKHLVRRMGKRPPPPAAPADTAQGSGVSARQELLLRKPDSVLSHQHAGENKAVLEGFRRFCQREQHALPANKLGHERFCFGEFFSLVKEKGGLDHVKNWQLVAFELMRTASRAPRNSGGKLKALSKLPAVREFYATLLEGGRRGGCLAAGPSSRPSQADGSTGDGARSGGSEGGEHLSEENGERRACRATEQIGPERGAGRPKADSGRTHAARSGAVQAPSDAGAEDTEGEHRVGEAIGSRASKRRAGATADNAAGGQRAAGPVSTARALARGAPGRKPADAAGRVPQAGNAAGRKRAARAERPPLPRGGSSAAMAASAIMRRAVAAGRSKPTSASPTTEAAALALGMLVGGGPDSAQAASAACGAAAPGAGDGQAAVLEEGVGRRLLRVRKPKGPDDVWWAVQNNAARRDR